MGFCFVLFFWPKIGLATIKVIWDLKISATAVKKWKCESLSTSTSLDPMDCSPPGSSVGGILQAGVEWVVIPFSRGSSQPRPPASKGCTALLAGSLLSESQGKPEATNRSTHCSLQWAQYVLSTLLNTLSILTCFIFTTVLWGK